MRRASQTGRPTGKVWQLFRTAEELVCQRPLGIPHWRPWEFPRDGHENSPRTAMEFPGPSASQWHHPLARGGVDEADRFALGDDDVGMVEQPIDERRGDGLVHELVEA
jgi:hypothetical protein